MSELEDLYRDLILEHAKHPVGKGDPTSAAHHHHEKNPTCGDELTMGVTVADGVVDRVVWEGDGCSISMASASVLADMVEGESVDTAREMAEEFRQMLRAKGAGEPPESLGDAAAFQSVGKYVMRVKCAMLGWVALEACLLQESTPA